MDIIIGIAMSIMSALSFNGSTTVNVDGTNYVLGGPVHTFQNYQDGGDGDLSQDDNVSLTTLGESCMIGNFRKKPRRLLCGSNDVWGKSPIFCLFNIFFIYIL